MNRKRGSHCDEGAPLNTEHAPHLLTCLEDTRTSPSPPRLGGRSRSLVRVFLRCGYLGDCLLSARVRQHVCVRGERREKELCDQTRDDSRPPSPKAELCKRGACYES